MQSHSYFSLSDQWSSAVKCGLLTATNYLPLCVQDMFLNWPVMLRALDNGAAGVVLTLLHSKAPRPRPPPPTNHRDGVWRNGVTPTPPAPTTAPRPRPPPPPRPRP